MLSRIKEAGNLDFALVPVEQNKTNHIKEQSRIKQERLWAYLSDHLEDKKQLRILTICATLDVDIDLDNSADDIIDQEENTELVVIPLREHLRKKCFRLINSKHFRYARTQVTIHARTHAGNDPSRTHARTHLSTCSRMERSTHSHTHPPTHPLAHPSTHPEQQSLR